MKNNIASVFVIGSLPSRISCIRSDFFSEDDISYARMNDDSDVVLTIISQHSNKYVQPKFMINIFLLLHN